MKKYLPNQWSPFPEPDFDLAPKEQGLVEDKREIKDSRRQKRSQISYHL